VHEHTARILYTLGPSEVVDVLTDKQVESMGPLIPKGHEIYAKTFAMPVTCFPLYLTADKRPVIIFVEVPPSIPNDAFKKSEAYFCELFGFV